MKKEKNEGTTALLEKVKTLEKQVSDYRAAGAEMGSELSSLKKSNAALRGYNNVLSKRLKQESDKNTDLLDTISIYNALPWYIKMFTFKLPID